MLAPTNTQEPARRASRLEACVAAAAIALWGATLTPLLTVGASNPRLVEAFSTDEAIQTNLMSNALRAHTWKLQFGAYGHLYMNLCLGVQKLLSSTTTQAIVADARAISLACAMGLLLAAFLWARHSYNRGVAWLTLLLLAINPTIYRWAATIHPDMLQAFLLLLALCLTASVFRAPTTANILAASMVSGLAFAAKYSGMFVLPLIAIAGLGRRTVVSGPGAELRLRIVRAGLGCCAVLLLILGLSVDTAWVIRYVTDDGQVNVPLPVSIASALRIMTALGGCAALTVATPWPWRTMLRRRALATTLWGIGVAVAAFAAVFALASPYSLWKLAFVKGLYFEATETGAVFNLAWIDAWLRGGGTAIGWAIVVPCACTALWLLLHRTQRPLSNTEKVLLTWMGLYIVVLLAPVHERLVHYTLPLIAPATILAAHGVLSLSGAFAGRRLSSDATRSIATSTALALVILSALPGLSELVTTRGTLLARENSPVVMAGTWLASEVPPSARIAYDYTSYVPPQFTNAVGTWGATPRWLSDNKPDFVVINASIEGAWKGRPEAESYYSCVKSGVCGYRPRLLLASISVYERIHPTTGIITTE